MPLKSTLSFLFPSRSFFKLLTNSIFLLHRPNLIQKFQKLSSPCPSHANSILTLPSQTIIFEFEGWLLKSSFTFPYFMAIAIEACSLFRAIVLLFIYPLICFMKKERGLKLMVMVCFFGVRKEKLSVARVVLSKLFMEDVGEEGFMVVQKGRTRVGVSNMPRVMVESFLKEYLEVEVVIARELKEFNGFYTGFMDGKEEEKMMLINGGDVLGLGSYGEDDHHKVFSNCKEFHKISELEKSKWSALPREKHPKPLIFHDGRLGFHPTPAATLAMFIWLPFGVTLSILRHLIANFFPYHISLPITALTGMVNQHTKPAAESPRNNPTSGRLYICNHRTLLDPVYISVMLKKPVTAVVYSLSPFSEFISPIKTARLTRNKEEDRKRMERLLKHGDLVVCPEGTTCREPYLLRFSPLFTELADNITPVALNVEVSMFYGTTACGFKWLDSFYFLMNPRPTYVVQFLEEMSVVWDGGVEKSGCEVANRFQSEIGRCLGFECTMLTRKDKYQMLAGNDGDMEKKKNM